MTTPENPKYAALIRGLSLWAATAVVVGAMIGQGVFLVTGDMARELGSETPVILAWVIGGVLALFGTLLFAELGAAMPEAGGAYVYLRRGLGPVWGFLHGWTSAMIMRPASAATIAAGLLRFATASAIGSNLEFPLCPKLCPLSLSSASRTASSLG